MRLLVPLIELTLTAACGFAAAPTFYRDVLPILQQHCQECHRAGEIGPMPLVTYRDTRPWARAIRDNVLSKKMPPWFADPCCGKFANDRSLTAAEIATISDWASSGSPEGVAKDAPPSRVWPEHGNLVSPDVTLTMPTAFSVPARGDVDYQRFILPTKFAEDKWVQSVEVRPSTRAVVHHVVVYIREPGDTTLDAGPVRGGVIETKADMLTVYAPGSSPTRWPEGFAKLIAKGSDLVMEIHYTPNGHAVIDQTSVSMIFAKTIPTKRVLTLQMQPEHLSIAAGDTNAHFNAWGALPQDAVLLDFFPHMHLRGKAFEFDRIMESGQPQALLRLRHYNFYWQMPYVLAQPLELKKGARLSMTGWFDNSANNLLNPDPTADVGWGPQSWQEMMVGFFDVGVDRSVDRKSFFMHRAGSSE